MVIVKIGGGRTLNLEGLAGDLAALGEEAIVVHGANAWRDELADRLGVAREVVTSASGYESVFTDERSLDVMLMAYAGLRNKRVVEALLQKGVMAVGLTGLDGGAVRGRRNRGILARSGGKTLVRRDLSGKPTSVNEALLRMLLGAGYTPVLTVPIADEGWTAVNSENDEVVALLQATFRARAVVQLTEAPGLLADPADPGSAVPGLDRRGLARWEERATGRFRRKLHAIGKLLDSAPTRVVLADGRAAHPLADALAGKGTVIR